MDDAKATRTPTGTLTQFLLTGNVAGRKKAHVELTQSPVGDSADASKDGLMGQNPAYWPSEEQTGLEFNANAPAPGETRPCFIILEGSCRSRGTLTTPKHSAEAPPETLDSKLTSLWTDWRRAGSSPEQPESLSGKNCSVQMFWSDGDRRAQAGRRD